MFRILAIILLIQFCTSCKQSKSDPPLIKASLVNGIPQVTKALSALDTFPCVIEIQFIDAGLAKAVDGFGNLVSRLAYSSTDNFTSKDLYGRLKECYLQPEVVKKLIIAVRYLQELKPGYKLILLDCARPSIIQHEIYEFLIQSDKSRYVAEPGKGSLHSLGVAVDITIADEMGIELDMGSPFDFFDSISQPRYEKHFFINGKLNASQIENRHLLRRVMKHAGFNGILSEWWHFNAYNKEIARARFQLLD